MLIPMSTGGVIIVPESRGGVGSGDDFGVIVGLIAYDSVEPTSPVDSVICASGWIASAEFSQTVCRDCTSSPAAVRTNDRSRPMCARYDTAVP